jgi:hypothetical protein
MHVVAITMVASRRRAALLTTCEEKGNRLHHTPRI